MNEERTIEALLRWLVFPILLVVFVFQAYACRALFADGASFLLFVLQEHDFPRWDMQRMTNHVVTLGPTLLALKLGVRDLVFLRYLFSSWLLFCPLFVWGMALWIARRDGLFWPLVMLLCLVYYGTNFFAIGEYNLCFALAVYCFAALVLPLPQSNFYRASLLIAAALLPLEYPATLFLGSLLFGLVVAKPAAEWRGASFLYKLSLALFFLVSVATAVWEIVLPRDPANFASAKNYAVLFEDAQFWGTLFYSLALVVMFFVRRPSLRLVCALLCVGLLMVIIFNPLSDYPFTAYNIRAHMALALAFLGVGLWWLRTRSSQFVEHQSMALPVAVLGMVLFVVLSVFDIMLSVDYAGYIEAFRNDIDRNTGLIPYEVSGVPLIPDSDRFSRIWTFPVMSIVLRDSAQKAVILNPAGYRGYEPFDPHKNIPDLNMYYR